MRTKKSGVICTALLLAGLGGIQASAAAPSAAQGAITARVFTNIGGGTAIANLTGNAKFPGSPDTVRYETCFELWSTGDIATPPASDVLNSYGAQIVGYFYPPETRDYTFWIASDDAGNLYLSTDDTAANKKLIAQEAGYSNVRSWDTIGGTSTVEAKCSSSFAATEWPTKDTAAGGAKITLQKGKPYYIEALLKEGGGGDNLSVSFDLVQPIPGEYLASIDKQSGALTITTQPKSVTQTEGAQATFTVVLDGTPPYTYQWTKNSSDIADATNLTYSIARVVLADNGAKFACKVTGKEGSLTTDAATLTVTADTNVPTLASAVGSTTFKNVTVVFSKPVDKTSAETTANYAISPSLAVTKATQANLTTVLLETALQTENTTFTLTVNNVKDDTVAGHVIAANSKITFQSYAQITGICIIEYWDGANPGIGGVQGVIDAGPPTRSVVAGDAQSASWENGTDYAARMQGVLIAPETGDYVFHIASDDQSQMWLSTDDSAANLSTDPICQVTGYTNQREWAKEDAQTAAPLRLVKGSKYYFRAYQVEGSGGDGLALGWELPSAPGTVVVIPGSALVNAINTANSSVTVSQQPKDTQGVDGKFVKFSVTATGKSDAGTTLLYQWQKNGVDIAGATKSEFITPLLTLADSGAKFKCNLTVPGKTVASTEVTLTVVADTFPPVVAGAGAVNNGTSWDVGVSFDEEVTEASAIATANYTLSGGSITGIKYYKGSPGVVLAATGLTAGQKYTVTVKNVADPKGNKITSASKDFTVSAMKWGVVGADELGLGNGVVAVADNGFDVFSDGIAEWATYDESTMVYEEITGDFDKKLRVEYQDSSSQWARAGLIVRDVLNFGVDRATQDGGAAGQYQKVHVNPVLTVMGTGGNNAWEGNRRLGTGSATTSAGGSGVPQYPNAWCRLQRKGQTFSIFRGDNGVDWTLLGSTTYPDSSDVNSKAMPDKVYVGIDFSPENGNIAEDTGLRAMWVAKFRDYGDTFAAVQSKRDYSIGINFGADEFPDSPNAARLAATDKAGVLGVEQKNWNNAELLSGSVPTPVVADNKGVAENTAVTVDFSSANTWSTAGRGETNNLFTGPDRTLMLGYLDTGDPSTTTVTVKNLPANLTANGYDVYVYTCGGVAGRGGGYRILDASGNPLTEWVRAQVTANLSDWQQVPETSPAGTWGLGNYLLFHSIKAAEITIQASTDFGMRFGGTARAPINAIQLVIPATAAPVTAKPTVKVERSATAGTLTITFENGSLEAADAITGPWTAVTGASPQSVPTTGAQKFYRAKR